MSQQSRQQYEKRNWVQVSRSNKVDNSMKRETGDKSQDSLKIEIGENLPYEFGNS